MNKNVSFVFKKYFSQLDTYNGEYDGLTKILNEGHQAMVDDVKQKENKTE